jgi:hypothetical protein
MHSSEASEDFPRRESANDPFRYWSYADLQERRIVGSRADLHRKQKHWGFPLGIVLSGGGTGCSVLYRISDVASWLEAREAKALRSGPVARRKAINGPLAR